LVQFSQSCHNKRTQFTPQQIKLWVKEINTMPIAKHIIEQIQKGHFGQSGVIQAVEGEFHVEVKMADCDRLGCLLNSLDLKRTDGGDLALDPIQLVNQVTYLGERLEVIENDRGTGRTILRSSPPRIEGDIISFFEMVIDTAKGLSLVRYKYDCQVGERQNELAPLTCDTVERLINDFIELLRENFPSSQ
jgi:hypothetical protein